MSKLNIRAFLNRARIVVGTVAGIGALTVGSILSVPPAAAAVTICAVKAEQPHPSSHFENRINAIGWVRCEGKPLLNRHLDVQVQQRIDGDWTTVGTVKKVLSNKPLFIRISASLACRPGEYRTRARLFANGRHHVWARSAPRPIQCESGAGGGGGGGW